MTPSSDNKQDRAKGTAPDKAFASFLEAVPDAMVAVDAQGAIIEVNAQAQKLFGYSRGELVGRTMEVLVPERARQIHARRRQEYMGAPHSRPMGIGMDLAGRHKSGAEIPVEISLSPMESPAGPLVLAAVRDVTERRQAQEDLKVAQAQLELKVAERTAELLTANKALRHEIDEKARLEGEVLGLSERERQKIGQDLHDNLGQTLTAVTYIAQLIFKRLGESTADGRDAAEIVKLVSGAIDQVRGLSRGLYPVELQTNGLVPALQELAAAAQSKWRVPCEVQCDDADPVKDPNAAIHVYRIAQEAVANAAKHGKAKKILIRLESQNGSMRLTVQDDGSGLPEALNTGKGMGLHMMRYRASLLGSVLEIGRGGKGGTVVSCLWQRQDPKND